MNPITLIAFHPTGYELHIPVTFEELPATMRRLASRGYTPSREPVLTAEGLPICPRHGVPMQQRNRNGDLWFSHKLVHPETGETMYCRGYASASSPGYDILLPLAAPVDQLPSRTSQTQTQTGQHPGNPASSDTAQPDMPGESKPERIASTIQDHTQVKPHSPASNGRVPQAPPALVMSPQVAIPTALFGPQP